MVAAAGDFFIINVKPEMMKFLEKQIDGQFHQFHYLDCLSIYAV